MTPSPSIFTLFFQIILLFCYVNTANAEETLKKTEKVSEKKVLSEPSASPEKKIFVLKITLAAIASLKEQLSEDQFQHLEEKFIDLPFDQLNMSLLSSEEGSDSPLYSLEELEKIQNSLTLYFDLLTKIQKTSPVLKAIYQQRTELEKLQDSLKNLLETEQSAVQTKISALEQKIKTAFKHFKTTAKEYNFANISIKKLPDFLTDLGYEDDEYDAIHKELSTYLYLIQRLNNTESIISALSKASNSIEEVKVFLSASSKTEEEKQLIKEKIRLLVEGKNKLFNDFTLTTTGIDKESFHNKPAKKINIEAEMNKVISPMVVNFIEFTEPSRRIEFLRGNIATQEERLPKIHKGLALIKVLIDEVKNNEIKTQLLKEKTYWEKQEKEITTKLDVAKQQFHELSSHKVSPEDAFEQFTQAIVGKRGLNILFSILIFIACLAGLLLFRRLVMTAIPFKRKKNLHFLGNLVNILLTMFAFIASTLALLVSLFVTGEMFAFAFIILILVGMLWALRNTLPLFIGQIKLLLGYGAVREGELVHYQGILWEVKLIAIYSYLENPLLTGGTLRLPIKTLINMCSRPYDAEKEVLFPCKEGDFIFFVDSDLYRKVSTQTPHRITFERANAPESMPTGLFLKQRVLNLSTNPFSVGITLQISYKHRYEILNQVIEKLELFVKDKFNKLPLAENLLDFLIDVNHLNDDSIDVMVLAKMQPIAAENYLAIKRHLQKICLQAANEYQWEIKKIHSIEQTHAPLYTTKTFRDFTDPLDENIG